jgi:hypothetical protein
MYVQVVRSDRKVACLIGKAMIGERPEGFEVNGNGSSCLVGKGKIYTVHVSIVVFPDREENIALGRQQIIDRSMWMWWIVAGQAVGAGSLAALG